MASPPHPTAPGAPVPGEFVGPWYTWWPGDRLPALPAVPGFTLAAPDDDRARPTSFQLADEEWGRRLRTGNRPYLARIGDNLVARGWTATAAIEIGELGLTRPLPPGDRYLWDFATAPDQRGRGLYPHLLQAILRHERADHARYWIGHEPGNAASSRGILKAGFTHVGDIFRLPDGTFALVPAAPPERARPGAAILGAILHQAIANEPDDTTPRRS